MGMDLGARKLVGKVYGFVNDDEVMEDFRCCQPHRQILAECGLNFSEIDGFKAWKDEEVGEMVEKLGKALAEAEGTERAEYIEQIYKLFTQCQKKGYAVTLG